MCPSIEKLYNIKKNTPNENCQCFSWVGTRHFGHSIDAFLMLHICSKRAFTFNSRTNLEIQDLTEKMPTKTSIVLLCKWQFWIFDGKIVRKEVSLC